MQHKIPRVGGLRWAIPPTQEFCVGYTNMLVSETLKLALPATPNLKFALLQTPTPNVSSLNMGCVGSWTQRAGIGHVDFMLFVFFSFALVTQHEPSFQWNVGFTAPDFPEYLTRYISQQQCLVGSRLCVQNYIQTVTMGPWIWAATCHMCI